MSALSFLDDEKMYHTAVISAESRSRSRSKKEGSFCDMGHGVVVVGLRLNVRLPTTV